MIEEHTLVDGGQTAEAIADRLIALAGRGAALARHRALRRAPARADRRRGRRRDPRGRRARRGGADRLQLRRRPRRQAAAAAPAHGALAARGARRAAARDPRPTRTSCITSTSSAISPRCGRARRTGRSTRGRARRTCSSRSTPPALAAAYARDFEDLWGRGRVEGSGSFDTAPVDVGGVPVRAWFSPGRGPELSHRIAERIGVARRRVRIASPVLTAAPILAALNQALAEGVVDVAGVSDATQVAQVFAQWRDNEHSAWKGPLLARVLSGLPWSGKVSTPYAPGRRPRLHAREGHGGRRRRLRRLLQPLALGRGERRERARDRRRRAGRADGGLRRRRCAPATRRSPSRPTPPAESPGAARPRARARRPRRGRR